MSVALFLCGYGSCSKIAVFYFIFFHCVCFFFSRLTVSRCFVSFPSHRQRLTMNWATHFFQWILPNAHRNWNATATTPLNEQLRPTNNFNDRSTQKKLNKWIGRRLKCHSTFYACRFHFGCQFSLFCVYVWARVCCVHNIVGMLCLIIQHII